MIYEPSISTRPPRYGAADPAFAALVRQTLAAHHAPAYCGSQWELALAARDDLSIEASLPYVPVSPEIYGLSLGPADLVVDAGCLAGFGMYDFVRRRRRAGLPVPRVLAIDIEEPSIAVGTALAAHWADGAEVRFSLGNIEKLELPDGAASLLVARGVVQYTEVRRTLAELARVIRAGGQLLVQWAEPSYYLHALAARPQSWRQYSTKLVSFAWFRATGRQLQRPMFRDQPMTEAQFVALAAAAGFQRLWTAAVPERPMALFSRRG
jgi:SAM-dependent methyltransferase